MEDGSPCGSGTGSRLASTNRPSILLHTRKIVGDRLLAPSALAGVTAPELFFVRVARK